MATKTKLLMQAAAGAGGEAYWINLLGGTSDDEFKDLAIDSEDNVICFGDTASDGVGNRDALIAKYANDGTLEWDRTLGTNVSTGNTQGEGVAVDTSDNIIVVGKTVAVGQGEEPYVAKYNSSGTIQWQKRLTSTNADQFDMVTTDSSDNIICVGRAKSGTYNKCLIAKYNSSGALQWDRVLGGSTASHDAFDVKTDSSGNIYLIGQTPSDGQGGKDFLIAKYNSSGTIQWKRTLGSSDTEVGQGIALDSSDNVYVIGYTNATGTAGGFDILIAKYNSSGTFQWDKVLGGSGTDFGYGIAVDENDDLFICAQCNSDGAGSYDFLIAKYNSSGTLQWDKTLGGSSADRAYAIDLDSNGNIFVAGYTSSDGAGGDDAMVVKLRGDGTGDGTYGSFTYADAVLTANDITLTDEDATAVSDSAISLTENDAGLTDAVAVLTEETIDM